MATHTVMGVGGSPFRPPFGSFAGKPTSFAGLFVSSTTGMVIGDTIEIMLDNGEFYRTTISSIPAFGEINITGRLPSRASAGNVVLDLTQANIVKPDNEDFLT